MRRCRWSHDSIIGRLSALYILPLIALATATAGVYIGINCILSVEISNLLIVVKCIVSLSSIVLAITMLLFSYKCYTMETQEYNISPNGITIKRARNTTSYTWNQIEEVAIVAFSASASRQRYQTVICCFLQKRDQNFLHNILNSYIYGALNTDIVVLIDYSREIMNDFCTLYPRSISDYRKEQLQT